MCSTSL
ncbi:hypothetical protein AYI68_g7708, partial [Smittium mucronatum]